MRRSDGTHVIFTSFYRRIKIRRYNINRSCGTLSFICQLRLITGTLCPMLPALCSLP